MLDITKKELIDEYKRMSVRCKKIWSIIRSEKKASSISKEQQNLLIAQLTAMIEYKDILKKRLDCWRPNERNTTRNS